VCPKGKGAAWGAIINAGRPARERGGSNRIENDDRAREGRLSEERARMIGGEKERRLRFIPSVNDRGRERYNPLPGVAWKKKMQTGGETTPLLAA